MAKRAWIIKKNHVWHIWTGKNSDMLLDEFEKDLIELSMRENFNQF